VQDVQKGQEESKGERRRRQNRQYTNQSGKKKLGEPWIYLKPVEQILYGATVPIKENKGDGR